MLGTGDTTAAVEAEPTAVGAAGAVEVQETAAARTTTKARRTQLPWRGYTDCHSFVT